MRSLLYVFREDRRMVDERTFRMMERIRDERPEAGKVSVAQVKDCVRVQAAILQIDEERAIRALPGLVPDSEGRERVLDAVRRISGAQGALSAKAQARLDRVQAALGLQERKTGRAANA
mgnify:FL=1